MFGSIIGYAANNLTLSSASAHPGDTVTFSIAMQNTDSPVAFQVMLPMLGSFQYVPGTAMLNPDRSNGHQVTAMVVNDTLRIYSYSLSLQPYQGNQGTLMTFRAVVGNLPGQYAIPLEGVKLSSANGTAIGCTTQSGMLTILAPQIQLGQSTIDYGHNPIRSTYNRSLTIRNTGTEPMAFHGITFNSPALSCPTQSCTIVAGGTLSADIVYSPIVAGATTMRAVIHTDAHVGDSILTIVADPYSVNELHVVPTSGYTDSVVRIYVSMNNMDSIVGLQMQVPLPEAMQYVAGSFRIEADRSQGHQSMAGMYGQTLSLTAYHIMNKPFLNEDGPICSFEVRLSGYGSYSVRLNNVVLSDIHAHNVVSDVYNGNLQIYSPSLSCSQSLEMGVSPVTEPSQASFLMRNNGNAPLIVSNIIFTQDVFSISDSLPITLNPRESTTLNISYSGTAEGDFNALMKIYSNDPNRLMQDVRLHGVRFEPNVFSVIAPDSVLKAQTLEVGFEMENYSDIAALQFDVEYPHQWYENPLFSMTSRCASHMISAVRQNDSTYRVILFSMDNTPIMGHSGQVATLRLSPRSTISLGIDTVKVSNVVLGGTQGNNRLTSCDSSATFHVVNNPIDTILQAISICEGECFVFLGDTLRQSGTYSHYHSGLLRDTIETVTLTVNPVYAVSETQTVCDSYDWQGARYEQSGVYYAHYQSVMGCDSNFTLNLTVNSSKSADTFAVVCDSLFFGDTLYRQSGNYQINETTTSGCDSVVTLHLTVNYSDSITETQTACDSYTWHGETYTTSTDTPTFTTTNAAGCDSVTTLHLTINYSNSATETQTACDSYTWNGNTYTASTDTPTHTTTNVAGCDSVTTLHLTINHSNSAIETVTACNSYVWHGTNYTASTTTPTYTTTNAAGCDSLTTLHLTIEHCSSTHIVACDSYQWNDITYTTSGTYISGTDTLYLVLNYSNSSTETQTACDSYTWHGTTYTSTTTTPTFTETNVAGCDSVVTLHLTINYSNSSTETQTACDSYTWHGNTYTSSTNATFTTTNAAGCDSVVTLNLTISYSTLDTLSVTAQNHYLWNGTDYTESGTYSWQGTTQQGCDSTIVLNLTIETVGIVAIDDNGAITLFPNPTCDKTSLHLNGINETLEIMLVDLNGRVLTKQSVEPGHNEVELNVASLAEGCYFVRIQGSRFNTVKKLIIQ